MIVCNYQQERYEMTDGVFDISSGNRIELGAPFDSKPVSEQVQHITNVLSQFN